MENLIKAGYKQIKVLAEDGQQTITLYSKELRPQQWAYIILVQADDGEELDSFGFVDGEIIDG